MTCADAARGKRTSKTSASLGGMKKPIRLVELSPLWDEDGESFQFICPLHPKKWIHVYVGKGGHIVTSKTREFEKLSVVPSLNNLTHGKKTSCGFHANLRDGVLHPSD